ncbi:MAG: hypothetical protein ABI863_02480 [Ginsengibacter sp.]
MLKRTSDETNGFYAGIPFWAFYSPQVTVENVGHTSYVIDSVVIRDMYMDSTQNMNIIKQDRVVMPEKNFSLEPNQKILSARAKIIYDPNAPIPYLHYYLDVYYKDYWGKTDSTKVFVQYDGISDWYISNQ